MYWFNHVSKTSFNFLGSVAEHLFPVFDEQIQKIFDIRPKRSEGANQI